jgi:bifunctional ADP-heptose synthase (sugar kinase/adenylyltransferase)
VRALKGAGRPLLPQRERAEVLAAFEFVDYVVIFREPNVEKVLLTLKPDVHSKGSDYTVETVPERETVKSYGGTIFIAGGPKVRSTKDVVGLIAARKDADG